MLGYTKTTQTPKIPQRSTAKPWLILGLLGIISVQIAHIMQVYLFLPPCEQCVYIRFAFLIFSLGCFIVALRPKNLYFKLTGSAVALYGIVRGIMFCLTLDKIQSALKSDTFAFGMKGCSLKPNFDFNLPLDVWIPTLFKPSAYCGYDFPIIPPDANLNALQEKLTALFSDGFYLIPSLKFGTMAQSALALLIIFAIFLLFLLFKRG